MSNAIANLSIKYKAYLLVGIGTIASITLSLLASNGLSNIKSKLDELVLSTNVERYAYLTILEEKNYLLNANASISNEQKAAEAFDTAKKDVDTINATLDKIDASSNSAGLLEKSRTARLGTNEYKELYYKGVDLLVNLRKETKVLEQEGETATLQAQEYVLAKRTQLDESLTAALVKKTNIATDIWKLTYVIRADEKRYMLNPEERVFERMKKDFSIMLGHLDALKKMASDDQERQKIDIFYQAAKNYETAAYKWVDLNKNLMTTVLPKMKTLGDTVVKQAMQAAEQAQAAMVNERDSIVSSLVVVTALAIILGLIFGYMIANIIVRQVQEVRHFLQNIVSQWDFSKRLSSNSPDEMGQMGRDIDQMLNVLQKSISEANSVLNSVAKADFNQRVTNDCVGDLALLKNGVNASAQSVAFMMGELELVMKGLNNGKFDVQMDNRVPQAFRHSVETALSSINGVVKDINIVMNQLNAGEFKARVNVDARGDLATMKQMVNETLETLDHLTHELVSMAQAQMEGDLTQVSNGTYRGRFKVLQDARAQSTNRIKEVINQVNDATNVVSDAANQVSQGSSDLSSRVQQQATALEETSATMSEMTAAVQANTANARKVADLTRQVKNQSTDGVAVMQETIGAMQSIRESSSKIADIVTLIDSIAFQTNLLALNAAVEAARAGEHGRGFAVVASEVRALAGKSADAAKDIKGLIEDSVNRIHVGTQLADKSGEMLTGISNSIEQVASMVEQIATASNEQSSGINQVHVAMANIDRMTQENAALVEETTAAAASLGTEASNLRNNMSFFKTGQAPSNAHRTAPRQSAKPTASRSATTTSKKVAALPAPKKANSEEWGEF
jgi:methyl-accepting chemotaxis protein